MESKPVAAQPVQQQQFTLKVGHFIGTVFDVHATSARFTMGSVEDGEAAHLARVGDYVFLEAGSSALIGQVSHTTVSLAEDPASTAGLPTGTVELVATITLDSGLLTPGVLSSPPLGAHVFICPSELVKRLIEGRYRAKESTDAVTFDFANLVHGSQVSLSVSPEKLLGRHCAIVGTSGGGKSWTVARMIEQCARQRSKVILFDATGEFYTLQSGIHHVHIGHDPAPPPQSREVAVPYFHLTETDLFAMFKPSGQSQAPKLRAAMKSLKLARLCPPVAVQGLVLKADRQKTHFEQEYSEFYDEIEKPFADFDIRLLTRQIENECVNSQRSAVEPHIWGGINGNDWSNCVPLINRIQDIIGSKNLAPVFDPGDKHSLFEVIDYFLSDANASVLRVSLKFLSFEHNTREIVVNAIGRYLLDLGRNEHFRSKPLVLFLDEAHQFLNASFADGEVQYKLDAFGLIAKEGRKYCLTTCIATQRPRDIPESVLSQMGTMIVHRLINQHDRDMVEKASCGFDRYSALAIPSLASGEAVLLGVDFPRPLLVNVLPPTQRPDSKGPDYQQFWRKGAAKP